MKHFGAEAAAATGTKWTGLVSESCSIEVYLFVCVREEREDRERRVRARKRLCVHV